MSKHAIINRVLDRGVKSLTHHELISVMLNKKMKALSDKELQTFLHDAFFMRHEKIGLTQTQCVQLLAFKECYERTLYCQLKSQNCLDSLSSVRQFLSQKLKDLNYEVFVVMLLNSRFCLIDYIELFRGSPTRANVYPGEVVKAALNRHAVAMMVAHNHPSGDVTPSKSDHALTKHLKSALDMVDIRLLDHIIVAGSDSLSFAERGYL